MKDEVIDQAPLAEAVAKSIPYTFVDYFLVKPLEPVKVTKEFSKPVSDSKPKTDENGVEAKDFDKVETEVKEVDSDFRKGVVIKLPMYYDNADPEHAIPRYINVGDIVVFRDAAGLRFDLVKDSRLLRQFDILGVEKQ